MKHVTDSNVLLRSTSSTPNLIEFDLQSCEPTSTTLEAKPISPLNKIESQSFPAMNGSGNLLPCTNCLFQRIEDGYGQRLAYHPPPTHMTHSKGLL